MYEYKELKQNFVVTGLERRLKQDKSGDELRTITDQLSQMTEQVEAERKSGLPPSDFYQADRLLSSLRVADQVVHRTWNRFHRC